MVGKLPSSLWYINIQMYHILFHFSFQDKYLRSKDQEYRKLRLKISSLRQQLRRIKSQQQQQIELREKLHPIDIDKLKIENKKLNGVLNEKNKKLSKLKRSTGNVRYARSVNFM